MSNNKYIRVLAGSKIEESMENAQEAIHRYHNSGIQYQDEVASAVEEAFAKEPKGKVLGSDFLRMSVVGKLTAELGASEFEALTASHELFMRSNSCGKVEESLAQGKKYTVRRGAGGGVLVTADYVAPTKPTK